MPLIGKAPFDPAPFPYLFGGISLLSLYVAILILTTQRRADKLASRREQMTLELACLSEHKTAKIIALLEELHLDSPDIRNRVDKDANAMGNPGGRACCARGDKGHPRRNDSSGRSPERERPHIGLRAPEIAKRSRYLAPRAAGPGDGP